MEEEKPKYPKHVWFLIVNEFCERFCYYGIRTLLSIYLTSVLFYSENDATSIFHAFAFLCYFTPVLGAVLADDFIGKFLTITILSIVYDIGSVTLTLASVDTAWPGMPTNTISLLGLFLIAVGTGGIKPCVSAFGGDQFTLPQQDKQLEQFFSIFYFAINVGSLISTFLTPILKSEVQCFGKETCYPLAFSIPFILMTIAIVIFLAGSKMYTMIKPPGSVVKILVAVIVTAIRTRFKTKEKRDHWLDHAKEKHGENDVADTKAVLAILILFIPVPVFWALYDQQGSRWTFQATAMDGTMTSKWSLLPEQIQIVNSILILVLIPMYEYGIYPLFAKCNLLKKPLQRMVWGMILAACSFLLSAGLEYYLEPTYAVVPVSGQGHFRIFNGFDCPVSVTLDDMPTHDISALGIWELKDLKVSGEKKHDLKVAHGSSCNPKLPDITKKVTATEKQAKSFVLTGTIAIEVNEELSVDDVTKDINNYPKIRVIYVLKPSTAERKLEFADADGKTTELPIDVQRTGTEYVALRQSSYSVMLNGATVASALQLNEGGVYSLLVVETEDGIYKHELYIITPSNSIHMMWQLPQYIVISMAEVMFSVTGLHFSFTQAPKRTKSVISAAWLLTTAFGNVIVVIIAYAEVFDRQIFEFLLFAALMFVTAGVFALMAWRYKPYENPDDEKQGSSAPN